MIIAHNCIIVCRELWVAGPKLRDMPVPNIVLISLVLVHFNEMHLSLPYHRDDVSYHGSDVRVVNTSLAYASAHTGIMPPGPQAQATVIINFKALT